MYGLIGKHLSHSYSADLFNEKFKREGLNECYRLFPINTVSEIFPLLKNFPELKGLNVTIPYKETIIPYLNHISNEVDIIGAANVIHIRRDNNYVVLSGYNTDYIGFRDSLIPILSPDISAALILGTGGAAKSVAYALQNLGIDFQYVSRNNYGNTLSYNDLTKQIIKEHALIVNATPLGMYPDIHKFPPIPYQYITNNHICFDLVYNPSETQFLKKAKKYGAKVKNGMEMLYLQAMAAWEIWNL